MELSNADVIEVYDKLAAQYELRADSLRPSIDESINMLSKYLKVGTVLDIGCGVGVAMQILSEHGLTPEGIDFSHKMVSYARKRNPNNRIINSDFKKYKFDNKYDGLLAFAFIHLFAKNEAVILMGDMLNILKPGGYLLIGTTLSAVSSESIETKNDYAGTHKRFRKHWTKEEFIEALKTSGFLIKESKIINDQYGKTWMDFVAFKAH